MSTAALNMLALSTVPAGAGCRLTTTDRRAVPGVHVPSSPDAREAPRSYALGPPPQGIMSPGTLRGLSAPNATPVRLRNVDPMELWARPVMPLRVERVPTFDGNADRAVVTGTVPRYLAARLSASDDALPSGDPVIMSFTVASDASGVSAEAPMFHFGDGNQGRREPAYAFAEPRAVNQALAAMLGPADDHLVQGSPAVARARAQLFDIATFENGAEPGVGAARLVHRAAWVQRPQAEAIARSIGPLYDCRIDPQVPSMIDEPRERPVAEALLTAALAAKRVDPALLYAFAAEEGLARAVESWHRGIGELDMPGTIDGTAVFAMTVIADEVGQLQRGGYLPGYFRSAFREDGLRVDFVAAGGRNALTNALTMVGARLAFNRDLALGAAGRVLGSRLGEVDQRVATLLTLLASDGGEIAVTRYLQRRGARSLLPSGDDLRDDGVVARAFMRTAAWEQMLRTGAFEGLGQ